jgi:tRNA(adenine34) deaminase
MPTSPQDEAFMSEALAEARLAAAEDEVPIGCVIEKGGTIIARGHNRRIQWTDPTAHAEMLALREAAKAIGDWRLEGCTIYVTLEPCPMCAGAIVQARLPRVVFGCRDAKAGACESLYHITGDDRLNHRCEVLGGVLEAECAAILGEFFRAKRALGKK